MTAKFSHLNRRILEMFENEIAKHYGLYVMVYDSQ